MGTTNESFQGLPIQPTGGYFIIIYSDTCNASLLEEGHDVSNDQRHDRTSIALMLFSSFALILEFIALKILARPSTARFGSMRKSLIILTATEMWLSISIFVHKVWEECSISKHETLNEFRFSFFLFSMLNSAICSRNWAVTLIALARCEAITRPVATRVATHVFTIKRQVIYIIVLIIGGIVLSTLRLVFRQVLVCTNLNNIILQMRMNRTKLHEISEKSFFAYQSAIPIAIVTISTIFMIVTLLRHRTPFTKKESVRANKSQEDHGCVVSSLSEIRLAQRLPNQIRATRFIVLIAAVFIICEAPIFFAVLIVEYLSREIVIQLFKYLRFLIVADSYANFAIYLLTCKPFQVELLSLLRCKKSTTTTNAPCRTRRDTAASEHQPGEDRF